MIIEISFGKITASGNDKRSECNIRRKFCNEAMSINNELEAMATIK